MNWADTILSAAIVLLLFPFLLIVRLAAGLWLLPATIFICFWMLMILLPLVIGGGAPLNPLAVGYLALCCAVFAVPAFFFDWKTSAKLNAKKLSSEKVFTSAFMYLVLWTSSLLAGVSVILQIFMLGFSIVDIFENALAVAGSYASARYAGQIEASVLSRIGLVSAYISVLSGGLIFGSAKRLRTCILVAFVAFVPATLIMLLQSAKGLIFLSLALFFGGILVTRIFDGNLVLITKRESALAVKALIVLFPLTVMSFMARGLYDSEDSQYVMARLVTYFVSYSSGHLFAFSDWFANYVGHNSLLSYSNDAPAYGFYSTMAFFQMFGDVRYVPMGIYDDYFVHDPYLRTNIFTAFRGLILDFGMLGAQLIIFTLSLLVHLSYYFFLRVQFPTVSIAIFLLFIGATYMSYIISILTWPIIPFAFSLFTLILMVNWYFVQRTHGAEKKRQQDEYQGQLSLLSGE